MNQELGADVAVEPWERLARYVGDPSGQHEDFLRDCIDQATALVLAFVGTNIVPEPVLDMAIIQTGSELFARRNAPSGLQQFGDGAVNPVRLARDPMTSVYPLLRRFVGWGIA